MTDKAVYRRSGMRTFYKVIDNKTVIRVFNREFLSTIEISNGNIFHLNDSVDDGKDITAAEFDAAFKMAKDRILNETI